MELELRRPADALPLYRRLAGSTEAPALALSRVARWLSALGREQEARAAWRELAIRYPDERDLSNRPYGIVAAIQAGETTDLTERITAGRWELSADQAEYFLAQLAPAASSPYLERFQFARVLASEFRPPSSLRDGETGADTIAGRGARSEALRLVGSH